MTTPLSTTPFLPKLESVGTNWTVFSIKFKAAMVVEMLWDHFDGSNPRPAPKGESATKEETDSMSWWDTEDTKAKMLLNHCIPDSTLIRIHHKPSARDQWDALVAEYTRKERLVQEDLCASFRKLRFPETGDGAEFFETLAAEREKIAACGVILKDSDCQSIISSLPPRLFDFASALLATTQLSADTQTIDLDVFFTLIANESERNLTRSRELAEERSERDAADSSTTRHQKRNFCWRCDEEVQCLNCGS